MNVAMISLLQIKELLMRYLLLFSVLIVGCGGNGSSKGTGGSGNASVSKTDNSEDKYKASVIAFIEESKSIVKAMDTSPDKATFDKRYKALEEHLTKIPAPPSGFGPGESWTKSNKAILANLAYAGTLLKNETDRNQLGQLTTSLQVLFDHYATKVRSSQSYDLPVLTK